MKSKFSALVTGGAGFIGSHLVDALVARGHPTRILDNLLKQAHPQGAPAWLNREADFIEGDLRDRGICELASWASSQNPVDRTEEANSELRAKGMIRRADASDAKSGREQRAGREE